MRRLNDSELAQLELAGTSAAEDVAEYTLKRGTPTYDDRRVGRMMARETWVATAHLAIAELRELRALLAVENLVALSRLADNVRCNDPSCTCPICAELQYGVVVVDRIRAALQAKGAGE